MNDSRRSTRSALRILIPLCSVICATAYATGSPAVGAPPAASATVQAPRAPLDLRVPKLRQVMTHSELLADMGPNSGDEESIEVIAAPALAQEEAIELKKAPGLDKVEGNCAVCHTIEKTYALFTDGKFHNLGDGMDTNGDLIDIGRFAQSKSEAVVLVPQA